MKTSEVWFRVETVGCKERPGTIRALAWTHHPDKIPHMVAEAEGLSELEALDNLQKATGGIMEVSKSVHAVVQAAVRDKLAETS